MNEPRSHVSVVALPAFNDNYFWILRDGEHAVVVDPGDATPVLDYLRATGTTLDAILITHHHADHVAGIARLIAEAPASGPMPVIGPAREHIAGITRHVCEGDRVELPTLDTTLDVIDVPGHTAGHIAYYGRKLEAHGALFCGDTVFGGGCGRLFEGTPAQMLASLQKIAVLPAPTLLFCAHEYTQANLRFALAVEPENAALQARVQSVAQARGAGRATVPLTLAEELATNPFLRWDAPVVRAAAATQLGRAPANDSETFAAIRKWKDGFR